MENKNSSIGLIILFVGSLLILIAVEALDPPKKNPYGSDKMINPAGQSGQEFVRYKESRIRQMPNPVKIKD